MSQKILLLIEKMLLPAEIEQLEEDFRLIFLWKERDPEATILENASDILAIISSLRPVRRTMIEALPNLEIIANCAVGFDNIDMRAAKERGVAVTNTPDVLTDDTADVGFLLMLDVARRAVEGDAYVRAGLWKNGPLPLGVSLSGKRVGIVGLGRIGRALARRAEGFAMDIVYHGPREKTDVSYRYYADLKEMAGDVDFLVLTCPGGASTHHMIDYEVLCSLGDKSFLVNIARGSVVVQDDLLMALSNEMIAGAGLDVYDSEPDVPRELFSMDNVVLTPHIGSATFETRTKMGQIVVDNVRAHFEGLPLLTPVGI